MAKKKKPIEIVSFDLHKPNFYQELQKLEARARFEYFWASQKVLEKDNAKKNTYEKIQQKKVEVKR